MTVYIEYVLIDNFVIDYLLLKATFNLTNFNSSKGRLLFCSFLGSLFALTYPLINLPNLLTLVLKVLFGLLLVLLSGKYQTFKQFYISTLVFSFLTFLSGGGIMAIYNLLGVGYSSEFSIGLMIFPAYALIKIATCVFAYVRNQKKLSCQVYKCVLTLDKKVVTSTGFMDTGNMLYDGHTPVVVCDMRLAKELFTPKMLKELKLINFSTVSGKSSMYAVKLTSIKIYYGDAPNIYNNVVLGISKNSVGTGYGVILHPALEKINDELKKPNKKIS